MIYRFGDCELDDRRYELRRGGVPCHLEPQVLEVLAYLVRHRDRVVPRTELLDEIWGSRFVTDSALASRVKAARRAVGDNGREQAVIRTVHGRGYQFLAPVQERAPEAGAGSGVDTGSPPAGTEVAEALLPGSGGAPGSGASTRGVSGWGCACWPGGGAPTAGAAVRPGRAGAAAGRVRDRRARDREVDAGGGVRR